MRTWLKTWLEKIRSESGVIATSTLDLAAATSGAILITLAFIPIIAGQSEQNKLAKALGEVNGLADAVRLFNHDTTVMPARGEEGIDNQIVILRSMPEGVEELLRPEGIFDPASVRDPQVGNTDWGIYLSQKGDSFRNHILVDGGDFGKVGSGRYRNPASSSTPVKWRGPYGTKLRLDPWGRNYLFLVRATYDSTSGVPPGKRLQGWIISAGRNGIIETSTTSDELNDRPAPGLAEGVQKDDVGFMFSSATEQ